MSICMICNEPLIMKDRIRPNIGTFECGHHFHLSCILTYSKLKMTTDCFKCFPSKVRNLPNFGEDRLIAMESLIDARSKMKKTENNNTWFNFNTTLQSMVNLGTALTTIKLKGYLPEDFIEKGISWKSLNKIYTVDSLLDFGFRWHHMIVMGFKPKDFKSLNWHHLSAVLDLKAADMMQTSMNIRDLASLNLEAYQLNELGFTWQDFVNMGGNATNMKLLTNDFQDFKTYFEPSQEQLFEAGFTEEKKQLYKNVAPKKTRKLKINGMVF